MWPSFEFNDIALNFLLLNLGIQLSVFLLLVLAAGKLLRKNPSMRYSMLYSGLVATLVLCGISLALQGSGNALLNFELSSTQQTATAPARLQSGIEAIQFDESLLLDSVSDSGAQPLTELTDTVITNTAQAQNISIAKLVIAFWLAGFLMKVTGLLRGLYQINRLASHSHEPSSQQSHSLNAINGELGNEGQMPVRISNRVPGPVLAGIRKPMLLLPASLFSVLSKHQLRDVLIHELAHVERHDSQANFIQKMILALFWFHPLAYLLDRGIDRAREEVCDNHVLQSSKPCGYGETLLAVQSLNRAASPIGAQNNGHPMTLGISSLHWKLEKRIEELLDSSRSHSVKLTTRTHSLILAATGMASLLLAGCQLQAAEDQSPEQRIAELEQQAQQLSQARAELEQQTRELEEQLRRSAEEQSSNANYRYRRQVLRSINEIRSLLQTGDQDNQFEDVSQLAQRVLEEISTATQAQGAINLSAEAQDTLHELIVALDADRLNREQLLAEITNFGSLLDITSRTGSVPEPSEPRPTPRARDREILSREVMQRIVQIQELMSPEDDRQEPNLVAAKQRLDLLMESSFENMNAFEKTTTLNFYTNYWLASQNYTEAINVFERILEIEDQRTSVKLRTLRSLGQLYAAEEHWQLSIDNYIAWNELSDNEDSVVLRGLSYGNYQLENYRVALDYWEQYMTHSRVNGESLDREKYAYLNGLYYQLEMYEEALDNTKEMVVLFNDATDWRNLRTLYAELGMLDATEFDDAEIDNIAADLNIPVSIDYTPFITPLDGEYLPLVAVAPQYPTTAAQNSIEGWVLVSFTVDEAGDVIEDSIDVVDADPPRIFNRSSMRAAARFKFQPRVTDGVGVPVSGVQYLFRYRLRDDA